MMTDLHSSLALALSTRRRKGLRLRRSQASSCKHALRQQVAPDSELQLTLKFRTRGNRTERGQGQQNRSGQARGTKPRDAPAPGGQNDPANPKSAIVQAVRGHGVSKGGGTEAQWIREAHAEWHEQGRKKAGQRRPHRRTHEHTRTPTHTTHTQDTHTQTHTGRLRRVRLSWPVCVGRARRQVWS